MKEQASRYFQSILPRRGKSRRFDIPASQVEVVIDMEEWFADDWKSGRKFSLISDVALFVQTADTVDAETSDTAETDVSASSPTADDTQMGRIAAAERVYFENMPGVWGQRSLPEKFIHLRGAAAGAVWIAVANHETA